MQPLNDLFGTGSKVKVLRHLCLHKGWEFSVSELAKDIRMNKGDVSRIVRSLGTLLNTKKKGITLFSLNQKHALSPVLITVFEGEKKTMDALFNKLKTVKTARVDAIVLYGSYAKGTQTAGSDVDVLIIDRPEKKKLLEVKKLFLDRGLLLNYDVMTLKEFKESREPVVTSIKKDHKVIAGKL